MLHIKTTIVVIAMLYASFGYASSTYTYYCGDETCCDPLSAGSCDKDTPPFINNDQYSSNTGEHNLKAGDKKKFKVYCVSKEYPYVIEIHPKHKNDWTSCDEGQPKQTGYDNTGYWGEASCKNKYFMDDKIFMGNVKCSNA